MGWVAAGRSSARRHRTNAAFCRRRPLEAAVAPWKKKRRNRMVEKRRHRQIPQPRSRLRAAALRQPRPGPRLRRQRPLPRPYHRVRHPTASSRAARNRGQNCFRRPNVRSNLAEFAKTPLLSRAERVRYSDWRPPAVLYRKFLFRGRFHLAKWFTLINNLRVETIWSRARCLGEEAWWM